MIRMVFLSLALFQPTPLAAETVPVRSGNHDGFARLLIDHDVGGAWSFGRVEGGFEFRAERRDFEYDLSAVFNLIPRNRILDVVDLGAGRLFIDIGCDCHGDAFDLRRGQVALDIKDGAAPMPGSPFEAYLAEPAQGSMDEAADRRSLAYASPRTPQERQSEQPIALPPRSEARERMRRDATLLALPDPAAWWREELAKAPETPATTPGPETPKPTAPDPGPPDPPSRVAETQDALLRQIARAASQGLLEADLPELGPDSPIGPEPGIAEISEPEALDPGLPPSADSRDHMVITTSVDRAGSGNAPAPRATDEGNSCLPGAFFDVAGWGDPTALPGGDLGAYRGRIVGEFDIGNGEGLTELARHYIFMSFGAEAKALVGRYPADIERGDLIVMMADVMDRGRSETAPALIDQMACDGPTALWAVLAQSRLFPGHTINKAAVAGSFAALPDHLRRHLGPELADLFLGIDDTETADMIRNASLLGPGEPSARARVMSARLDASLGEIPRAIEDLDEVIYSADTSMPDALLDRVETTLASGWAVPPDLISLLASVAYERRGQPGEIPLIDAEVRAHASAGDFGQAFARLGVYAAIASASPARIEAISAEIFEKVLAEAADPGFLEMTIPRLEEIAELPPEPRREIARRLLDLGFPTAARRVLGGEGALPEPADRLLYARAALIEQRPEVAIGYLAGLDDSPAGRVRAQALERAGDYAGAVREYDRIGDETARAAAAWRGGIWSQVEAGGAGPLADASRSMQKRPGQNDRSDALPSLAQAGSLVEASRETRSLIADLLSEIADPASLKPF